MMQSRSPFPPSSFRDAPEGAGPESILTMAVMDSGLAAARRPGMTTELRHAFAFPRRDFASESAMNFALRKQRAQGMPGAGRTRSLVC